MKDLLKPKAASDTVTQLVLQMQSTAPWCGSHGHIGPAEPHRQGIHSHIKTAAHIYQPRLEVVILVTLSNSYLLENTETLQTKDPNNPLQVNPRPQGYRIRLTSGAVTAAFSVVL